MIIFHINPDMIKPIAKYFIFFFFTLSPNSAAAFGLNDCNQRKRGWAAGISEDSSGRAGDCRA